MITKGAAAVVPFFTGDIHHEKQAPYVIKRKYYEKNI